MSPLGPPTRRALGWILPLPLLWGPGLAALLAVDPFAARALTRSGLTAGLLAIAGAILLVRRCLRPGLRPGFGAACARDLGLLVTALALARWAADHLDPRVPFIEAFSVLLATLALGWSACLAAFLTIQPLARRAPAAPGERLPALTTLYTAGAAALGLLTAALLGVALSARAAGGVDRARLAELHLIADLLAAAATHGDPAAALTTLHGELYLDAAILPGDAPPPWLRFADEALAAPDHHLLRFDSARFHLVRRPLPRDTLWIWQTAGVGPPIRAPDDAGAILILALLMLGAPLGAWLIARDVADQLRPLSDALDRMGDAATAEPGAVPQASNDEVGDLAALVDDTVRRFTAHNRHLGAELAAAAGSDRTRTGFLHTASYELRTPLTTITGYCHLLQQTPLNDAQREDIRVIADASTQLLDHVDEILDLSRIEAGEEVPLQRAPLDLTALARDELQSRAPAAAAITTSVAAEPIPLIHADRARIRQIIANLLDNALKFTTAGYVELRLRPDTLAGAPAVHLEVADTGPGIPQGELEAIFVEFHRVAAQRGVAGTGLGLAIARRLVERHGGRLWAESTLGEGSTFHLLLPVDPPGPGGAP
ncbi:MAG: HAMP domain-containing histidine kinase [Myxococcales bacterium]|nr:HAMP domain-containing histidine kinase [Myxococcales bacterium]